jgi:tRNA modification GTPase
MRRPGDGDTIAAIATAPGEGGIGIVRVSGPAAPDVAEAIFRGRGGRRLADASPSLLVLGAVVDPASGQPIDEVLAVRMPEGRSYTGQATLEIHAHGGRAVLDAVLGAALAAGARPADPGEFTKRAFLSGRIDLAQAEAVAGIIAADTEQERRAALAQLQGGLSGEVRALRELLLDLVAAAEAAVDFEDDEGAAEPPAAAEVAAVAKEVRALVARGRAHAGRQGATVVIAGRTNAGKSSLFNMLLNFERSIVAPVPGTTRDYVAERSVIEGSAMTLVDTAGLRESGDAVEAEGVRRSRRQILAADLVVACVDGSEPLEEGDLALLEELRGRDPIVVITKADLPQRIDRATLERRVPGIARFTLSVVAGDGCAPFIAALAARCAGPQSGPGSSAAPNARHLDALRRAAEFLDTAEDLLGGRTPAVDRAAVELQGALSALGEVTGETADDEVLDRVFSRFCIGK